MEEGIVSITITQPDLVLAVRLLIIEVSDSDEWWDTNCRSLLGRVTGHEWVARCDECDGEGHELEKQCHRCDGLGYLTPGTKDRHCHVCHETRDLEIDEGMWICDDEQCGIEHVKELQGIEADRWCAG
jgi:hypothetical protein